MLNLLQRRGFSGWGAMLMRGYWKPVAYFALAAGDAAAFLAPVLSDFL
jgi:hypothetical protein